MWDKYHKDQIDNLHLSVSWAMVVFYYPDWHHFHHSWFSATVFILLSRQHCAIIILIIFCWFVWILWFCLPCWPLFHCCCYWELSCSCLGHICFLWIWKFSQPYIYCSPFRFNKNSKWIWHAVVKIFWWCTLLHEDGKHGDRSMGLWEGVLGWEHSNGSIWTGALGTGSWRGVLILTLSSPCTHPKSITTPQLKYSNIPSMMMGVWGWEVGMGASEWKYWDRIMGMGAWVWEHRDGNTGTGIWG